MEQRIVCAAVLTEEGRIVAGVRHCYAVYSAHIEQGLKVTEQGFLDNFNNFLSRKEAWEVAVNANQIIRRVGGDGPDQNGLFSDNLY